MGFFNRGPKLHSCFFCSDLVVDDKSATWDHYATHLIEVTDNNGNRAFTFKCPSCGLMDEAWDGGRPDPTLNGVSAIFVHLMQRHDINLIT